VPSGHSRVEWSVMSAARSMRSSKAADGVTAPEAYVDSRVLDVPISRANSACVDPEIGTSHARSGQLPRSECGEGLADALLGDLDRGAELLGEEADAQLLDHPAHVVEGVLPGRIGSQPIGGLHGGLVGVLELADRPRERRVLVHVLLGPLDPPACGLEVPG